MLRDIKTRFGATYFGFLIGLLMPLAHIGIVLTIYVLLGRRAPIGTDVRVYLATAIVPFIIWSYTHKQVMQSFMQNRSLTHFPIVKFLDILIARSIVEIHTATLVVFVVISGFIILGVDIFVANPAVFFCALIMAFTLGVSSGFVFGILAIIVPGFLMVGFLIIPIYWVTSGVFFIPEGLPELLKSAVSLFPLSHIVDFGRTGFYDSYVSSFPIPLYVCVVIVGNLVIGLTMERFLRPSLTKK